MRSFADLKLIWKIALPVAFLTAIAAFVAWQALGALSSTNSIADSILDKNVHKALLADVASFNINSVGVDSRDMILESQEADKEKSEARYNADIAATSAALNSLDALESNAGRKADLAQIRTLVRKLQQKESTVIGLAYANKTEDAYAFVAHQAYPVYRQLRDRLDAIVSAEQAEIASERDNLKTIVASSRIRVLGIAVLGFLFGIGVLGAIALFQIAWPIGRVTAALKELADGNLGVVVDGLNRTDEVGTLANALQVFKQSAINERKRAEEAFEAERARAEETEHVVEAIGSGLDSLAKGDLTHRIDAEMAGTFAKLKGDFNMASERLEDAVKSVLSGTDSIGVGAGEISHAADDLSRRTEQQAASLEETAAALEEITATVMRTAQNAKDATALVTKAKAAAEEGGNVVKTAIAAMGQIEQSSRQITDIISVIDEIAFQTNLLALNAGVEAARAGDAGRGFAVVASEVRALAQRSGQAAKEIKTLIQASGSHVASGVKYVGESGDSLKRIVDQVVQINALVSEMASAAHQQSTGIEEVNAAVAQMDQVTQQNAAMVEQSTAASRNLAAETAELNDLVAFFKVGDIERVKKVTALHKSSRGSARSGAPHSVPDAAPVRSSGGAAVALAARGQAQEDWQEF